MRGRVRTTVAAATMLGAAVLAFGAIAPPAQAQETTARIDQVQAAPGWHYVGTYTTSTRCRQQGEAYLAAGWAIRFECRGAAGTELWVLTNP
ncbi:hypothetical protein GCM10022419_117700 [Nonomuraea rosea]|uniref:Secreted protein n=1 Tax=Nonomuraea rosea TaxID=638574 RepID=A0ABP6ZLF0_9ACTN